MKTQHTPGPWAVSHDNDGAAIIYETENHLGIAYTIAEGAPVIEDKNQREANARLIAASPDLLDTLQRFVTACDAHLPEPTHQAFCGLFASARAAITKATGAA